jgi:hypothetical protein
MNSGFKQNPRPVATTAFSERSITGTGSKAPSKVTFTESEVTSIDGVRVRDDRYVTRKVEEVKLDAGVRGVWSDGRRQEREREPEGDGYGHTRGWQ